MTIRAIDELCINTIRFLAVDAVQKANSGHPGAPMGMAPMAYVLWDRFLKHNPTNPKWPNRDRFVLSAGHAAAYYESAKWAVALVCGITAVFYCTISGFGAVVITDFVQFTIAMIGSVLLAAFACRQPEVGGLTNLIDQLKTSMPDKLEFMPHLNAVQAGKITLGIVIGYSCIRWWSQVMGGMEPGDGQKIGQQDAGEETLPLP